MISPRRRQDTKGHEGRECHCDPDDSRTSRSGVWRRRITAASKKQDLNPDSRVSELLRQVGRGSRINSASRANQVYIRGEIWDYFCVIGPQMLVRRNMKIPKEKPPWVVRSKRWLLLWWRISAHATIAPLVDRTALLQLIAFPIFLYLVFLARGFDVVSNEAINSWAAFRALLYAVPVFIIWNMISAIFSVASEEKNQGQWFGTEFVYHEPLLVAKFRVSDKDNGNRHKFKVPQAEIGGSIQLQIGIGGVEKQRIKAVVVMEDMPFMPPWEDMTSTHYYSILGVPKNKTYCLSTMCETLNPSLVSVYLVSWNIH